MIRHFLFATVASVFAAASAQAQTTCACSGGPLLNAGQLNSTLLGNTVCVSDGAGGWTSQEQHRSGSQLWDYKRGSPHATDETRQVGTWNILGSGSNSRVEYIYNQFTPNATHEFRVCRVGTTATYGFCPGTTSTTPALFATVKAGITTGCP